MVLAVPAAEVVARNDATGQEYATVTSDFGLYVFPTLNTGVYSLSVEKAGFKKSLTATSKSASLSGSISTCSWKLAMFSRQSPSRRGGAAARNQHG